MAVVTQNATVERVAQRFRKEVGVSPRIAYRLTKKLNALAKKVPWAVALPEENRPKRKKR